MKLSACVWSVYIVQLFFFLICTKEHSQNDRLLNISLLQKHNKKGIIDMVIYTNHILKALEKNHKSMQFFKISLHLNISFAFLKSR